MSILILFAINLLGSFLVTREELANSKPLESDRTSLMMGKWPYNLVLLVGVGVLIITSDYRYGYAISIAVVALTVAFYGHRIFITRTRPDK